MPNDDSAPVNGSPAAPQPMSLTEAKQYFAEALMESVRLPNGMQAIDPRELLLNSHLDQLRISAIADALVAAGFLDPADLSARTVARLQHETLRLKAERQHVLLAHGSVPRA